MRCDDPEARRSVSGSHYTSQTHTHTHTRSRKPTDELYGLGIARLSIRRDRNALSLLPIDIIYILYIWTMSGCMYIDVPHPVMYGIAYDLSYGFIIMFMHFMHESAGPVTSSISQRRMTFLFQSSVAVSLSYLRLFSTSFFFFFLIYLYIFCQSL